VNGDGTDDLLTANQQAGSASVYLGTPGALAFSRTDLAAGHNPVSVAAGDFTGDGRADIAIANGGDTFVTLYRGRARGGWARLPNLEVGYAVSYVSMLDVTGDGCRDLVMTGNGAVALALCVPSESPVFAGYVLYGYYDRAALADFDSDGLTDLAITDVGSGRVRLLFNIGGGGFSDGGEIDVPLYFTIAAAGDVSGDGRADLVLTSYGPAAVWVIQGNGDGTFGVRQWIDRDVGAAEGTLADVNGDGTLDVLLLATMAKTPAEYGLARPSLNVLLNAPLVSITTPNTAEHWAIGSVRRIAWTHRLGTGARFRVEVSRDGGGTWTTLATTAAAPSTGAFSWRVAGPDTDNLRFRVSAERNPLAADLNDAPIRVADAFIDLNGLNSLQWGLGSTQTLRWRHNLGARAPVVVELSRDGSATWESVGAAVTTSGSETSNWKWTVTGPMTQHAVLRVRATAVAATAALPNVVIGQPFIELLRVRPATPWNACEPRTVRWRSNLGRTDLVRLEASTDSGPWQSVAETASGRVEYSPPENVNVLRLRAVWTKTPSVNAALGPFMVVTTPVPNWCDDGQ
jgi:hypothetical protein